jgi:hypothetical protein
VPPACRRTTPTAGRRREPPGGQRPLDVTGSAGIVAFVDEVATVKMAGPSGAWLALGGRGRVGVA